MRASEPRFAREVRPPPFEARLVRRCECLLAELDRREIAIEPELPVRS